MEIIRKTLPRRKDNPYHSYLAEIYKDKRLSPSDYKLLVLLLNWSRKYNKSSINGLAELTNMSRNTIERSIKNLKQFGYITSSGKANKMVWEINEIPVSHPQNWGDIYYKSPPKLGLKVTPKIGVH